MYGVLAVNLGTPTAPTPAAVGRYLREFLADPRVVDQPRWWWLPLLYGVIVPLRRRRSAAAYAKVWTPGGSPLLLNSRAIAQALEEAMRGEARVRLAMRYGEPGVTAELAALREQGVTELCVLPLYPQYSHTTTGSVCDAVADGLRSLGWSPRRFTVLDYHADPAWVAAVADSVREFQSGHGQGEMLLFSLHGIPQRYVRQGDPYAEQCHASVAAIRGRLDARPERSLLTFQSRVGREPWLQPYTDHTLEALARDGVRHVQVVCPGFSADCLETLEEIALQNAELFREHGGERLDYIPALNDRPDHIAALAGIVRRRLAGAPDAQAVPSPR